ncbi:MAG TPA: cytochrome c3 family protein [Acidobacteriaceae bacterium]|nr:cytochrome c3 family protein [Acidobacteriaceae bacterium]
MRFHLLAYGVVGLLLCPNLRMGAQDIDSIVTTADARKPATIADEIRDPAERSAFSDLMKRTEPQKLLPLSRSFLERYPQSAFLSTVADKAARASFDLGDYKGGMEYARFSLSLLPENPLLLVAVADVQALLMQNEPALSSARDALDYLDRFDRPATISKGDWPAIKRRQQASAWFAIGRALVNEALVEQQGSTRGSLLRQAASSLARAQALNPQDMEIVYLRGIDSFYSGDLSRAASEFAAVCRSGGELVPRAREQLLAIYKASKPAGAANFDAFVSGLENRTEIVLPLPPDQGSPPGKTLPGYAGSDTCGGCHVEIYSQWKQSGMSKMLRPYKPENVIGDFQKSNEFYAGDRLAFYDGKLEVTPEARRVLFARMVARGGRHYFDIKQSDGRWHSYPVDYTIGSKWQQAYATTLPNGQIHVFPIQYSTFEKKWVNYWSLIDAPGTERADPLNWEKLDVSTSYQANCAVCHTSQLRNTLGGPLGPDNIAFREPGIDCEMCHGPSAAHVDAIANEKPYQKGPLDPPVEFDRISNRDFVAICSQCHMQSNVHQGSPRGELNYSSTGTFFLKNLAMPLNEFSRGAFFKDGRFRQTTFMVEALERSQCYRKGQASCGSCHDPHGHDEASNRTSLKFRDNPDRMCTSCHTQFQEQSADAAHTHHATGSEASRCVSCHMPRIMDSVLFRARSHQIDDIPNAAMTIRFGQQESPNACLLCHTRQTPQWVQAELQSWRKAR